MPSGKNNKRAAKPKAQAPSRSDAAEPREVTPQRMPSTTKKSKHKIGAKEIAVFVVSIIMVVSILLPSFAQIFASQNTSSTSDYPMNFEETAALYEPQVNDLKSKIESNPDDTNAIMDLADVYLNWGVIANSYATDDAQELEAKGLLQDSADTYTSYLDAVGNLDSDAAKGAAVNRGLAYYYAGDNTQATKLIAQLAEETNYAPAWANLGMIYEASDKTSEAMSAFQKGIDADPDDTMGAKSYCETRLNDLRANAQETSGGAASLSDKLDATN